jgi:hypothetical protein
VVARDAGALHIESHVVRYRVARGGNGHAMRSALDEALTGSLVHRLRTATLPGDAEGVWRIRRLDVRTSVAASSTPGRVANLLAAAVAAALERTLERGSDGDGVLWYPDRAAFLARFLVDCADGRAAGRWQYGEFGDLTGASSSAAIRDAVSREPGTAIDAMVRLGPADLRRLLRHLAPPDSDAVLDALARVTAPDAGDPAPLVVGALRRLLDRSALPHEAHAAALAVFLEVARHDGSPPSARTAPRARESARLAAALRAGRPEEAERLGEALAVGAWRAVGAHEMGRLSELVAWPADARRDAVGLLVRARSGAPGRVPGPPPSLMATDLGGMFLLLPLLEEFPLRSATASWPGLDGMDGCRLADYLAVIGALGADRGAAAVLDPMLRLALGVPPEIDAEAIARWSRGVPPIAIVRANRGFVAGLRRLGTAAGAVTIAPQGERVVAVDGRRGIWLGTAPPAPASIRDLVASIEAGLGEPAAVAGSEAWIEACLQPERAHPDPPDSWLLARLEEQARYAALGPPFDLAPAVRDMLMLGAQALGRDLAWRLPGLTRSSLPYLWENVLSFPATVSVEPDRFVVRMGDPPFHVVLSLAGMNRRTFLLDATGDSEWVLTRER